MNEMPNYPRVNHCHCYGTPEHCVCGETEKALRGWCNGRITQKMTPDQREWCLQEIDSVEGYERQHYQTCSDELLANGVLSAWVDYCRDKGLL